MKKTYFFVCLFICMFTNAQECGFVEPQNYQTYDDFNDLRISNSSSVTQNYCINVCFWIVRDNNGTNAAFNATNVPLQLTKMNTRFNPHGIFFNQVGGINYLNNTAFNNGNGPSNTTNIPGCLNIFFVNMVASGQTYTGIANYPQNRLRVRGIGIDSNSETINHEVGHCLNLLHTFECTTTNTGFDVSCAENPLNTNVNTNECGTKGDMVCDTPADYYNLGNNTGNPYPLNSYHPDLTNIMSQWNGRNHFTTGQGIRMKNSIIGSPYLQNIRSSNCYSIVGPSKLCRRRNQNGVYSVSGEAFAIPPTYNWSVSGKLQIIGASTNPTVNVSYLSAGSSSTPSIVSVTLNGTSKTKTIRTNCFLGLYRISGVYDWVSKDYGNMGLIVPIDPEDEEDPIVTYNWEIIQNLNALTTSNEGTKPYFVGATANETNKFTSTSNQAIVNWGSASNSYLITCRGTSQSGEEYLITENYVDVGDPKNNPCFKNTIQSIIAPNPVRNGKINVVVIKPENTTPCNYKNTEEAQFFNSELDRVNNSITIFDFNGNEIYRNVFETNVFTIEGLNLISGNNYVVNLFTNEGGFRQQVIIAE